MKNTNKNMLYTFWSGAILLCLALVAVVLVFTNAVGNTHTSKPKDDPAAAVTPTPTPQVNPITPIQSSAALAQTEDKGSTYVDQIYFLGDKSLKVLQTESMLTGKDAKKQVWGRTPALCPLRRSTRRNTNPPRPATTSPQTRSVRSTSPRISSSVRARTTSP